MQEQSIGDAREIDDQALCAPPPIFPIEAFPTIIRQVIIETAKAYGVPYEVPALAVLIVAAACIGRTRGISIKPDWIEFPNLYAALVGTSGTGKSPATSAIFAPINEKELDWYDEWVKEVFQAGKNGDQITRRQLIADDSTVEALSEALAANPRGILWFRDELTGLLLSLDRYGGKSGTTKSRLMTAYDSGQWKVNRINQGRNLHIPHATLSLFGTVVPSALSKIFSNYDVMTGFWSRFIFVRLPSDGPPLWSEKSVPPKVASMWEWTVQSLLDLDFDSHGDPIPINVTPDAKNLFVAWHDALLNHPWSDLISEIRNPMISKLRAQCLRIALIFHCIRTVGMRESEVSPVGENTMQNSICLSNYLLWQQQQIYAVINSAEELELSPPQMAIAKAIISLEAEITGGFLSTARIAEKANEGLDERFHITGKSTGKIAASLGLKKKRHDSKRGVFVTAEDFTRLKNALGQ